MLMVKVATQFGEAWIKNGNRVIRVGRREYQRIFEKHEGILNALFADAEAQVRYVYTSNCEQCTGVQTLQEFVEYYRPKAYYQLVIKHIETSIDIEWLEEMQRAYGLDSNLGGEVTWIAPEDSRYSELIIPALRHQIQQLQSELKKYKHMKC